MKTTRIIFAIVLLTFLIPTIGWSFDPRIPWFQKRFQREVPSDKKNVLPRKGFLFRYTKPLGCSDSDGNLPLNQQITTPGFVTKNVVDYCQYREKDDKYSQWIRERTCLVGSSGYGSLPTVQTITKKCPNSAPICTTGKAPGTNIKAAFCAEPNLANLCFDTPGGPFVAYPFTDSNGVGCCEDPNDNNACTTDSCNPVTHHPVHVAKLVDDNNACTVDTCSPTDGEQHTPITQEQMDDGLACTKDSCDPNLGIQHIPLTPEDFDDGNPCTVEECIEPGGIKITQLVDIQGDNDPCTKDICDDSNGTITFEPLKKTPAGENCMSPSEIMACGDDVSPVWLPTGKGLFGNLGGYSNVNNFAKHNGLLYATQNYHAGTNDGEKSIFQYDKNKNSWKRVYFSGGLVWAIHSFDNKLFAAESDRISYTSDDGATWQLVENMPDVGKWSNFAVLNGMLYISGTNGVFRSADGLNWEPITTGLPQEIFESTAQNITALLSSGGKLYAGTKGNNGRVFTFDPFTDSWQLLYEMNSGVLSLGVHLDSLYAGSVAKIMKHNQVTQSWETVNNGLPASTMGIAKSLLSHNGTLYTTYGDNVCWKSAPPSNLWEKIGFFQNDAINTSYSYDNNIYIGVSGVYHYACPEQFSSPISPCVDGEFLKPVAVGNHIEYEGVSLYGGLVSFNGYLYAGDIGGVRRFSEDSNTWEWVNNGLPPNQIPTDIDNEPTVTSIRKLISYKGILYAIVHTDASSDSGFSAYNTAIYQLSEVDLNWTKVANAPSFILDLAIHDGKLYAGGYSGVFEMNLDNSWSQMGDIDRIYLLADYDDYLLAVKKKDSSNPDSNEGMFYWQPNVEAWSASPIYGSANTPHTIQDIVDLDGTMYVISGPFVKERINDSPFWKKIKGFNENFYAPTVLFKDEDILYMGTGGKSSLSKGYIKRLIPGDNIFTSFSLSGETNAVTAITKHNSDIYFGTAYTNGLKQSVYRFECTPLPPAP